MKRTPAIISILAIAILLPILLWSTRNTSNELRGRADDSTITPTVTTTPSTTPTITLTPSPSLTPTITPTATLTPTPTNAPPKCNGISVQPGAGSKPLTVHFACAGYDSDNDITAAEFGFGNGDKQLVEKNVGQFGSLTASFTYTESGTYHVTCRVRDNNQVFSSLPSYCQYDVYVSGNSLTPTPIRQPTATRKPEPTATPTPKKNAGSTNTQDLHIYTGGITALTRTPTASPTAIPSIVMPESVHSALFTGAQLAQLTMMVIVSGITIVIAFLLHGFFDKRH